MYEPQFSVRFTHKHGLSLHLSDALAIADMYTQGSELTICFRNEAEAEAFFAAVEQEQAARTADMVTEYTKGAAA